MSKPVAKGGRRILRLLSSKCRAAVDCPRTYPPQKGGGRCSAVSVQLKAAADCLRTYPPQKGGGELSSCLPPVFSLQRGPQKQGRGPYVRRRNSRHMHRRRPALPSGSGGAAFSVSETAERESGEIPGFRRQVHPKRAYIPGFAIRHRTSPSFGH